MKHIANNNGDWIKATQHVSNIIENSCRYHTTGDFLNDYSEKNYFGKENSKFSLIPLNIRSLDKKWTSLIGLLKTLEVDFPIIALSEIGRKI